MSLPPGPSTAYDRVTVYAIDDDTEYLELFHVAVAAFSGLNLETFHDPKWFIETLPVELSTRFVIFFLDIRLGPTLGFELCEKIRSNTAYAYSPVVFMSSSLMQQDIDRSFRVGANAYFFKPAGTRARVDAIRRQLTYWLDEVRLPNPGKELEQERVNRIPSRVMHQRDARARGTPLYALDRLRQDILGSLIKDLGEMSGQTVPESIADKIEKSLIRLQEIFDFNLPIFGEDVIESIGKYCNQISAWLETSRHRRFSQEMSAKQRECLYRAQDARKMFGKSLRKFSLDEQSRDFLFRLDTWIWDVFNELGDNPMFPSLYISLRRFQSRAF